MKYVVNLNGKNYEVEVTEQEAVVTGVTAAAAAPVQAPVAAPAPAAAPAAPADVSAAGTNIPSPMPGSIISVNVAMGQAVKSGDVLIVLEAMKMENDIVAPCDGTVKQILVSKGTTVNTDDVLIVI